MITGAVSVASLGSEVAKCALPHIHEALESAYQASICQVKDTTQYSDFVEKLRDKHPTTSWVQAEADKANARGEDVNNSAVKQLRKKENPLIRNAEEVLKDFEKNGFTCCMCLPNLWRRHRIGRKARKCLEDIDKFRKEKLTEIVEDETPPGELTDDSRLRGVKLKACELPSQVNVKNLLMGVLKDDRIQRVGVYGPEGVGKTRLMKQVVDEVDQYKLLHQRIHVEVPEREGENGIEAQIQEQIAKLLVPGVLDKAKEFNDRAARLREGISGNLQKKAVIIIDGLWRKIDLDAIGIPNNDEKVCNVIVTARDMDLLVNDMGLSIERTFKLETLSLEESRKLFLYIVRRSEQTIDEEKKSLAGDLVKYCGGIPSLIEQQASVLTNHRHISAWHDALRVIKSENARKMLGPVEKILHTWSPSRKDQKEIKSLFSLCGLFGESSISVDDLTVHCRALGMLAQNVKVKETKNRVKSLLHILRAKSLLDGDNSEVKITDLLREVAVLIASKDNCLVIRNGSIYTSSVDEKWTKQLQKCTALSMDELHIFEDHPELKCLKMLQLGSRHHSLEINDDKFFSRMKELRGLHLKQVGFKSSSFPSTIENLENLQTLCLDGCRLKNVSDICKLKKLQILKISGSDIVELPEGVKSLTDLRVLDLRGCQKLQVIKHGVLRALRVLEELYLDDSFDKWELPNHHSGSSRRNASLDELNEITWLSTLHVYVPKITMFPENFKLKRLERYKILLGNVKNYSEESIKVRTLRMDLSYSTSILWEEGVERIMHKTKALYLRGMMRMPRPSIHQLCSQGFPCLTDLHLQNCDSVEFIVESSELVLAFPNLETLTLDSLRNLKKICSGRLMDESFGQLNAIIIENCNALENLFDFSLMEKFSALKNIKVKDCKNVTKIVNNDTGDHGGTTKKIKWDQLRHLSLENLEQIMGFCIFDTTQAESLETQANASGSTAFFNTEQISFPGLESLSLIRLPKVKNIWPQNISPELTNLQSLLVQGFETPQLEDILFYSPQATPQNKPLLQRLTQGFCYPTAQHNYDSHSPSPQGSPLQNLCCLIVLGCKKLEFLFTTSMAQALPHLTKLRVAECEMMKQVLWVGKEDSGLKCTAFQKLTTLCLESLEKLTTFSQGTSSVEFPSLKSLKISDCHELKALFTDFKDIQIKEEISGSLFHAKVSPSFPSLEELEIYNMNKLTKVWQCQAQKHGISSQHRGESSGSSSKDFPSKLWKTFLSIKKLTISYCSSLEKILDVEEINDNDNDNDNYIDVQLKEVSLEDLKNIEHIWGMKDPRGRKIRYRYLERVSLCKCQKIESLFPASMAKDLLRLESLMVTSCGGIKYIIGKKNSSSENDGDQFFFPAVKVLELQELPKLMTFYFGPHCSEWPSLERLMVSNCKSLKIFGSNYKKPQPKSQLKSKANQAPPKVLPKLEPKSSFIKAKQSLEEKIKKAVPQIPGPEEMDSLPLFSVKKDSFCRLSTLELSQNLLMNRFWGDFNPVEFRKLKTLKLISSSNEPVILPIKFLLQSPHLESLQVHNHDFRIDMLKTPECEGPCRLPIEQSTTKRPLSKVELSKIPGMADLKEALDSLLGASSYSFGWLTSLEVSNCDLLEYLLTCSTAKSLGCLTRLAVANCEKMKVIVASEEGKTKDKLEAASEEDKMEDKVVVASKEGETKDEVILHKLERLTLDSLEVLTSFCEENWGFGFPSLEEITIRECYKMKRFSHGEASSPNLIKVELNGRKLGPNINKITNKEDMAAMTGLVNAFTNENWAAILNAQSAARLSMLEATRVAVRE